MTSVFSKFYLESYLYFRWINASSINGSNDEISGDVETNIDIISYQDSDEMFEIVVSKSIQGDQNGTDVDLK